MRILVISPQPFFSPRGTPFSVYYRTLVTAELGAKIDLLTYGEGEDVNIPGVRIIRIPRFSLFGNIGIGPSYLKLFLDVFIVLWSIFLLLRNRYNIVHAHEEAVFFCMILKPAFGFKLIYDMHSSLPQQLKNFKFTRSKLLHRLFKTLEDFSLRAADGIITICPDLAHYVDGLLNRPDNHFMIENSIFEPVRLRDHAENRDPELPAALPASRPLVVYAGTLEPYQGIDILVRAFAEVARRMPESLLFVMGGTRDQVMRYRHLAEDLSLKDHVMFTGRVPQKTAKYYSGQASVLVSPRSGGTNTPLKIYEQLASGIPLVATRIYSHTQVLTPDVAFLVEPTPDAMAEGILAALKKNDASIQVAQNALALYEEKYSRPVYTRKLKKLLKKVH